MYGEREIQILKLTPATQVLLQNTFLFLLLQNYNFEYKIAPMAYTYYIHYVHIYPEIFPIIMKRMIQLRDVKKLLNDFLIYLSSVWCGETSYLSLLELIQLLNMEIIQNLYLPDSDMLMNFQDLQNKYKLDTKYFLKYLQLRIFIKTNQNNDLIKPTTLKKMLTNDFLKKGIISKFYHSMMLHVFEGSYDRLKALKKDLWLGLIKGYWQTACTLAHNISINTGLKMIQFKWLMQIYITPVDLTGYNWEIPDICTESHIK